MTCVPLEALSKVLAPPQPPVEPGNVGAWPSVEKLLGLALPGDYKEFVNRYGSGSISDFLYVHNPFSKNRHGNLIQGASPMLNAYQTSRQTFPKEYQFPVYPDEGGVYPWGSTDNGDELYWVTNGEPDQWPTLIVASRGAAFELLRWSLTELLLRLLTSRHESRILTRRNILPPTFTPAR
jgi:hypothetical protein